MILVTTQLCQLIMLTVAWCAARKMVHFPGSFQLGRNFHAYVTDVRFISAKFACDSIVLSKMPNLQGFCQLCTDLRPVQVCQRILASLLVEESAKNLFKLNNGSST